MNTLTITEKITPRNTNKTETKVVLIENYGNVTDAWTAARFFVRTVFPKHDRLDMGYLFALGDHQITDTHLMRMDTPTEFKVIELKVS